MNTFNNEIARMVGSKYVNDSFTGTSGDLDDYWSWTEPDFGWPKNQTDTELSSAWMIGNFKFHKSWDWLMLAIEWIEDRGFSTIISNEYSQIHGPIVENNQSTYAADYLVSNKSKLENTYEVVYYFAMWWNQKESK